MGADCFHAALDGVYQIAQSRVERRLEPDFARCVHHCAVQVVDLARRATGREALQHAAALTRTPARGEPDECVLKRGRLRARAEPARVEADDLFQLHSASLGDGDRLADDPQSEPPCIAPGSESTEIET